MEPLLYFAAWAILLFVLMRFGCGPQVMGSHHARAGNDGDASHEQLRWIPPERDLDPVCRRFVWTANAKPSVHGGTVYYFCSRDCREIFEVAPERYVLQPEGDEESEWERINA